MSTKFGMLEFSEKFFSFAKSSISQTREKWDSPVLSRPGFLMVWRCHDIVCVHFYFYLFFFGLEATFGQDIYKSDFRHCYSNFFESGTPISRLC